MRIQFTDDGWLQHPSMYVKICVVFTNLTGGKNFLFKFMSDHHHPFFEQLWASFVDYLCMRYVYILLLFKLGNKIFDIIWARQTRHVLLDHPVCLPSILSPQPTKSFSFSFVIFCFFCHLSFCLFLLL